MKHRGIAFVTTAAALAIIFLAVIGLAKPDMPAQMPKTTGYGLELAGMSYPISMDYHHWHQVPQQSMGSGFHAVPEHHLIANSTLGECASCHADEPVLSDGHPPTLGMPLAQCRTCHVPHSDTSLAGLMPLDHTHALAGVGCASCHTDSTEAMTEPAMEVCQACHGSLEELAARTANVEPTNPHASPHGPPYAECSLCHMQHEPSQNFCAACHDFEFNLP